MSYLAGILRSLLNGASRTDQCTRRIAARDFNLVQCESSPGMSE